MRHDRTPLGAQEIYQEVLAFNPRDPLAVGNYAVLLHRNLKEYDKAEIQYNKAIEMYPNHASILNFYATFLKSVRKDYEKVSFGSFMIFLFCQFNYVHESKDS